MDAARRDTQKKIHILAQLGLSFEAEIILEAHSLFREGEEADAHSNRRRRNGGNPEFRATRENLAPNVQNEEIESIDKQIRAGEEGIHVLGIDAGIEPRDPDFGID